MSRAALGALFTSGHPMHTAIKQEEMEAITAWMGMT